MSRRKQTSLPRPVQEQLNSIALPKALIRLDDRGIDIIQRYRKAKEAMRKAISNALANQNPETMLWTPADTEAVELADRTLTACQVEMCALLDVSALSAGV